MPDSVSARNQFIDSLSGISDFDWITTPTTSLDLSDNMLTTVGAGAFNGLDYLTFP